METTQKLHNDKKETLVEINEDLFKLVSMDTTVKEFLKKCEPDNLPHIRYLNPIPVRSKEEEERHNKEIRKLHVLAKDMNTRDTVTIKSISNNGGNISKKVEELLKQKEKAQKEGDEQRARQIRRQLRSLDYKRYLGKGK